MKRKIMVAALVIALTTCFMIAACDIGTKGTEAIDQKQTNQRQILAPEIQQQVDQLGIKCQEVLVTDDEGQTFLVNEEGVYLKSIACPYPRCCRYTYVIDGVKYYKYYSMPVCPTNPAYKDVGPCPTCPP